MTLRIAPGLDLDDDFATEGVGIIGMRGSGKSNTEVRWAEALYDAGIPFVAVDPKGDWDGIRSSSDGKSAGLPIPVFGGLRGDFPLEANVGKVVADLLVDQNLSAVLDVSLLPKTTERARFLIDFFKQLMRRQKLERTVRNIILEEAHTYIPQNIPKEGGLGGQLKEAAAAILLEGRAFGLGCWACSQRPARIHKDVLEEVGTLVIHRIGAAATNDKRTIEGWVKYHDLGAEIMGTLTSLKAGEAWVLAPETLGIVRVQVERRRTFDSAATPKVGVVAKRPATMADIDAAAIKEAMAETIEKAEADDPKRLHRQIADLTRRLNAAESAKPAPVVEVERVEVPVLDEGLVARFEAAVSNYVGVFEDLDACTQALVGAVDDAKTLRSEANEHLSGVRSAIPRSNGPPDRRTAAPKRSDDGLPASRTRASSRSTETNSEGLTEPQQRVIDAIAWWNAVGFPRPSKMQVGFVAGYRVGRKVGGNYGNILGGLRSAGLVDYPTPGAVELTAEGEALAGEAGIEPTTAGLQAAVFERLNDPEQRVLQVLIDAYPDDVSKQEVGEAAGYRVGEKVGGNFGNILGRLRSLGLIGYPAPGRAIAEAVLFL